MQDSWWISMQPDLTVTRHVQPRIFVVFNFGTVNYASSAVDITDGNVANLNNLHKTWSTKHKTQDIQNSITHAFFQGNWWQANVSISRAEVGVIAVGSKVCFQTAVLCRSKKNKLGSSNQHCFSCILGIVRWRRCASLHVRHTMPTNYVCVLKLGLSANWSDLCVKTVEAVVPTPKWKLLVSIFAVFWWHFLCNLSLSRWHFDVPVIRYPRHGGCRLQVSCTNLLWLNFSVLFIFKMSFSTGFYFVSSGNGQCDSNDFVTNGAACSCMCNFGWTGAGYSNFNIFVFVWSRCSSCFSSRSCS